ncbi:hypothetical protein NDU88_005491 [Pleurodeles waltl]|uniref:Uncharacterized protein n=1 Tax=Pleurodeles waltl TaxID=8319 RepID=A0AAV7QJ70_PLEWA|nr:hypothetical protein NDU88_005491 [Pleurodeles waltl]
MDKGPEGDHMLRRVEKLSWRKCVYLKTGLYISELLLWSLQGCTRLAIRYDVRSWKEAGIWVWDDLFTEENLRSFKDLWEGRNLERLPNWGGAALRTRGHRGPSPVRWSYVAGLALLPSREELPRGTETPLDPIAILCRCANDAAGGTRSRCILRALHNRRFMSAPRSGDARTRPRPPQLGLARLRAAPCPMRALVGPPAQAPARKGLALPWTRKRNSPLARGGEGRAH